MQAAEKSAPVVTHTVRPDKEKMTGEQMRALKLPPGFRVNVFAKDLGNPRMMVVTEDGAVLVTRMVDGKVTLLHDKNGDGGDDPNIVLLHITGERAEYWDNTGANRFSYLYQSLKAVATGTTPEIREGDQHDRVTLTA